MRGGFAIAVVLGMLAAAACSRFDGNANVEPDAGGVDGPDADRTVTPDAGDDAYSGPPTFCDSHRDATVCSDFDRGGDFNEGWDPLDTRGNTDPPTVATTDPSASPPGSLLLGLGTGNINGSGSGVSRLRKNVAASATRTTLSFAIQIAFPSIDNGDEFVSIAEVLCGDQTANPSTLDGVFLQYRWPKAPAIAALQILAGPTYMASAAPQLTVGAAYSTVVLDITWATDNAIVNLEVNGQSLDPKTMPTHCFGKGDRRVVVGLSSGLRTQARYDNVVLDVE